MFSRATPSLTFYYYYYSLFLSCLLMLFFIIIFPSLSTFFLRHSRSVHNKVNANILHEDPRLLSKLVTREQGGSTTYSSGYRGAYGCTCDKKYTYAVCAEQSDQVVKIQLDPFSIVAGTAAGNIMRSCDLYDTGTESTSLVFCIQGWGSFTVFVYNASDMTSLLSFTVPDQTNIGVVPHILVDTPNRVLYVSNNVDPGYIFKFSNIDNVTAPTFEGNCSLDDGGSQLPAMMAKVDDLLFVYHNLNTGRLSSVNLTTFTWNATINFSTDDGKGDLDNVVADHNYVYVLTAGGASNPSIVRCSFHNNEFRVVNALQIGIASSLYSLAISPDLSYLLLPAASSGLMIVKTSTFKLETSTLWTPIPVAVVAVARDAKVLNSDTEQRRHAQAQRGPSVGFGDGRPVITPDGRIYAPRSDYGIRFYNFTRQRVDELYPTLRPIKDATISDSILPLGSNTKLPLGCVANANETFFVCALYFGGIVKYNLHPISFAMSVSTANDRPKCDIFENATSNLIVCTRYDPSFTGLETLNSSNFASVANWTSPYTFAMYSWVLVDSPSATAYASSYQPAPNAIIYKVVAIDSLSPYNVANITFLDADYPTMLLHAGGFLYCYHYINPVKLTRVNLTDFALWNATVIFDADSSGDGYERMVNDDKFIYVSMSAGYIERVAYDDSSFYRVGNYLSLSKYSPGSIAITNDLRFILVIDSSKSRILIVDVASLSLLVDDGFVADAYGRPLTLRSTSTVYAFSSNVDFVYAFNTPAATPTVSMTSAMTESQSETLTVMETMSEGFASSRSHTQIDSHTRSFPPTKTREENQTASKTHTKILPTTTTTTSFTTSTTTSTTTTSTATRIPTTTTTSTKPPIRRQRTATLVPVPSPVAAPQAVAAPTSVGATVAGAISADLASPTMTMIALSISAVGKACGSGVNYVDSPPSDEELQWPQGSLIPTVQILLSSDAANDYWRRHFRGAALANFVIFPALVVSFVAIIGYGLRSTPLREQLLASYIFSAKKSTQPEKGEPDLIADARLFAVALFVFGIGLEGGVCAIAVLIGAPRASSSSIGIDYTLVVISCIIILVVLCFLVKIVQTTKEKLECAPAAIRLKNDPTKDPSSAVLTISRILYGYNGWTLIDTDDVGADEVKRFFLRFRVVFLKNVGPFSVSSSPSTSSPEQQQPSKLRTTIQNIAMYTVFVSFFCTIFTGVVRGLIIAGALNCRSAAVLLLIIQIFYLCWSVIIQSALAPINKLFNVAMTFLLFYAAISLFYDSAASATLAITGAAILSIIGLAIAVVKILFRRGFGLIIFPTRDLPFVDGGRIVENKNVFEVMNEKQNDKEPNNNHNNNNENTNNNILNIKEHDHHIAILSSNPNSSDLYNVQDNHNKNLATPRIIVPNNETLLLDSDFDDDDDDLFAPELEMQPMSRTENNNNNKNYNYRNTDYNDLFSQEYENNKYYQGNNPIFPSKAKSEKIDEFDEFDDEL